MPSETVGEACAPHLDERSLRDAERFLSSMHDVAESDGMDKPEWLITATIVVRKVRQHYDREVADR